MILPPLLVPKEDARPFKATNRLRLVRKVFKYSRSNTLSNIVTVDEVVVVVVEEEESIDDAFVVVVVLIFFLEEEKWRTYVWGGGAS